jgi:3-oxoacyl-[acyl-carrier-protein] synthase-3
MQPEAGINARGGKEYVTEIVATGYAYPSERVDNESYFARCCFPISDDRAALVRDTQMQSRYWCGDEENTWTLAKEAVAMALSSDPTLREEIDVVLVASGTTMPVLHPPERNNAGVADLAPLVLRDLVRSNALGLDIKACYCTGFLRGLQVMDGLLQNPNYRAGLVIATEQGSRFAVAETNRSTFCFIMADAAGAAIVRRRPHTMRTGIVDYVGYTDASKHDWVGIGPDAASTVMKGSRAAQATHEMLVHCARMLLDRNDVRVHDVDWLVPIQTHAQVVAGLRTALEWPREKLLWFGDVTGFSGSASIPACLAEQIHKGVIRKGDLILSLAVGAGLNCAGVLYYY